VLSTVLSSEAGVCVQRDGRGERQHLTSTHIATSHHHHHHNENVDIIIQVPFTVGKTELEISVPTYALDQDGFTQAVAEGE